MSCRPCKYRISTFRDSNRSPVCSPVLALIPQFFASPESATSRTPSIARGMPAPAWPCAAAVCRFPVTQRDDLEPVGGLGIAAANGGSVKSRLGGQICVGANKYPPGVTVDQSYQVVDPLHTNVVSRTANTATRNHSPTCWTTSPSPSPAWACWRLIQSSTKRIVIW